MSAITTINTNFSSPI